MTGNGIVIAGGSQASVQFAGSLRELGYEDPITIIDDTHHLPYQRPPLSKDFLAGEVDVDGLRFRLVEWYDKNDVTVVLGSAVVGARRDGDHGVATTADGAEFPYDRLAIAVGAAPRRLEIDGSDLAGLHYLRDADDADRLKRELDTTDDVVVIGGGFIGLEVAAGSLKRGKTVTVLEAAPRIIGRAVGEETSEWFLQAHRKHGMDIRTNAKITRFVGDGARVTGVELDDGTVIPAGVVVIGIGVIPRTELAEQLGLETNNGIVVDENSVASDGSTIAIGDVANLPNPYHRTREAMARIRLESVNNAVEQAKSAAAAVVGAPKAYESVPWFWSNQGELRLQMAGLNMGFDRTVWRGDPDAEKFAILYYRGDTLLGADCVNNPVDFMAVKRALGAGQNIPAEAATSAEPLKKLVVDLVS